ncbi:UNVERIFIED_CONTAM: Pantothenate kinase [Sesamum angustifolium]|uniref:Pantothenate kinase n=1 Tax=Sesamum angustifolium TaxID=2727405 RepID=A0AAW2M9S5_9LAMI
MESGRVEAKMEKKESGGVSRLALDIGGSLIKMVYFPSNSSRSIDDQVNGSSKDGLAASGDDLHYSLLNGRLHFFKFETSKVNDCIDFISSELLRHCGARDNEAPIGGKNIIKHLMKATGGGAFKFADLFKERLGITLDKVDEMDCLVSGANFLLKTVHHEAFTYMDGQKDYVQIDHKDLYPYLLVNIGSGVSMIKVESDSKFQRVSGTSIGGGTFWGLGKLLTKCKSFDELLELSHRGNNRVIDMLVGDIYGGWTIRRSKGEAKAMFLRHEGFLGALGAFLSYEEHDLADMAHQLLQEFPQSSYSTEDGFRTSGKRTEKRKYVSISNKAKNEAQVDCTSGNGIFKKLLKPGEKIRWHLPKGTGVSMICHVDIQNEDHVHGYFSAFLHKRCKNKCRWRILDDGRVQLKLNHGKWKTFKLELKKEDARMSVSSPGKGKSLPVPPKKQEQHRSKEGEKCLGNSCLKEGRASPPKRSCLGNSCLKEGRASPPKRSTEGTQKPKEQKCLGKKRVELHHLSGLQKEHKSPKSRRNVTVLPVRTVLSFHHLLQNQNRYGKVLVGCSCGSTGEIAPAPTKQKQQPQQPKKCGGKSCGKDTKVLPPAKQTPVSKEAKKCDDVKVAPPPTQRISRDTKTPPPTEGKPNSRNAKKCAGDSCGSGAKLAPAPSKQKSQQSKKCDGVSCAGKTKSPPPVSGKGKSRGPGADLVPPPRKEARRPTTTKGKERSTVPDGKLAPPPTKQKSKLPKKCESVSCEKTGPNVKLAPPPTNQKSKVPKAKLAPPPANQKSKVPKAKLAPPPANQKSEVPKAKLAPPPRNQKSEVPKAKFAPPPTNQKSKVSHAKLASPPTSKKSKGPDVKLAPPPTSQQSKGLKAKLAPPPTNQKSKGSNSKLAPPPSSKKSKEGPTSKLAPPPINQKSKGLAPPPTNQNSKRPKAKVAPPPPTNQKSKGPHSKLAPPPADQKSKRCDEKLESPPTKQSKGPNAKLASPPTNQKFKGPNTKLAPPPTNQKSKQPHAKLAPRPTNQKPKGPKAKLAPAPLANQKSKGPNAKLAPPPTNQKFKRPNPKLAPPPTNQKSKGPTAKLAPPPTNQISKRPTPKLTPPPTNQKSKNAKESPSTKGKPVLKGPNAKLAPSPTKQKFQQTKKCVGASCEKNATQPPPAKGKRRARGVEEKLAPPPTKHKSQQPNKCDGTSCEKNAKQSPPTKEIPKSKGPDAKFAPPPTKQKSQKPKKCDGVSCEKNAKRPQPTEGTKKPKTTSKHAPPPNATPIGTKVQPKPKKDAKIAQSPSKQKSQKPKEPVTKLSPSPVKQKQNSPPPKKCTSSPCRPETEEPRKATKCNNGPCNDGARPPRRPKVFYSCIRDDSK